MPEKAIIIMAKAPVAGTVKTRLTPFLSSAEAAELAACFVQDTALKAQEITENVIIAFAPKNGREKLEKILPQNLIWHRQTGADLGERLNNAFLFAAEKAFSPLVVIGTDSPNLPSEFIRQAFFSLENKKSDAVLGATEDGGFYLLGLQKPAVEIFSNVEWSSEKTFAQTLFNIEELKLFCDKLPIWYDVDFPADLRRLSEDLAENPASAPQTANYLCEKENFSGFKHQFGNA